MSHICNFITLSLIFTLNVKNSNPTVALYESSKIFLTALIVKHDLPTPLSPITINLKLKSKLVCSSGNISYLKSNPFSLSDLVVSEDFAVVVESFVSEIIIL